MNKLLPILKRDFSDFEATDAFEAGIPIYFVRLAVEVLEPQELTGFESYFLRAIALGVNTQEGIAHLLGVDGRDLVLPGASLLKLGYINQNLSLRENVREIQLTQKGRQALSKQGPPPVPKRKLCQIHFNALTWTSMPFEENSYSIEQMCKKGITILPKKSNTLPTLGDFTEEDVKQSVINVPSSRKLEIINLLELKKIEPEYIVPVTVIQLEQQKNGEKRLAIYRNSMLQRPESAALQRMFDNGAFIFPTEVYSLQEQEITLPTSVAPSVTQATQNLVENESRLDELKTQLEEQMTLQGTTQNTREREELKTRIEHLKDELRIKRQDNEELRQELRQNQVEFLRTEEHRPVLMRALREAQEKVIIISPWMNRRACNDELCQLVLKAVMRGVHIHIGYGMGREREPLEAARNRENVYAVKNALNRNIPGHLTGLLEIKETSGTHQKILICDDKFAVTSSFNWLSYLGQVDEGYRKETGTLFRHSDQVSDVIDIALQAFNS